MVCVCLCRHELQTFACVNQLITVPTIFTFLPKSKSISLANYGMLYQTRLQTPPFRTDISTATTVNQSFWVLLSGSILIFFLVLGSLHPNNFSQTLYLRQCHNSARLVLILKALSSVYVKHIWFRIQTIGPTAKIQHPYLIYYTVIVGLTIYLAITEQ